MIERYQLRYFLGIVDQGNFSRAAAHCNVSQPTLSAGIAKLERAYGTPLFVRSNQRVELTEDGARLLAHARRIEREFTLAQQVLNDATPRAALRIGLLHSIPGALTAAALAGCATDDRTLIEFVPGSERELQSLLGRGRIEIALTLLRPGADRFAEQPLLDEGYGVAMPAAHALTGTGALAAEALGGEVMIVRRHCEALSETSRYFTERGVRPHFALRTTNDERVLQMVAAGLGVTVMPMSYAFPGVTLAPLAGFDLRRTIGLQYGHGFEHLRDEPPAIALSLARSLRGQEAGAKPVP